MTQTLADRLRTQRGDLSRNALARRSGVAESTIIRIEGGADPSVSTLRRLATALGVSVVELLGSEQ